MSFRGGRGGRGRGGGGGGGGGGFRGGRGGGGRGYDQGPPEEIIEVGHFTHCCEDDIVCQSTCGKIPYFNAPVYFENKEQIGKIDEIFGSPMDNGFSVTLQNGIKASSFKEGQVLYIDPAKLLPVERFLSQGGGRGRGSGRGRGDRGRGGGSGRGDRGRGGFRGGFGGDRGGRGGGRGAGRGFGDRGGRGFGDRGGRGFGDRGGRGFGDRGGRGFSDRGGRGFSDRGGRGYGSRGSGGNFNKRPFDGGSGGNNLNKKMRFD